MKLYVGNLPFSMSEEALKKTFSEFGNVEEASIIIDKFSKRSKGFGFVTFSDDSAAKEAVSKLNGKEVEGRALKVSEAKPMEEGDRPRRSFGGRDSGDRPRRSFGGRDQGRSGGSRRY